MNTEPFLVGEFLVLPERNELRQLDALSGRPRPEAIRLTAKQMDVLVTLASRPGQPVSKNELFEAVWPGVVVGEDNITSCIYELRKAFGEQGYIRTVRQRGYVLTPSVVRPLPQRLLDELEPERPESAEILLAEAMADPLPAPAAAPALVEPPEAIDRWGRRQLAIWLGALALLVAATSIWLSGRSIFKVGFEGFSNVTGKPEYDEMKKELERRFLAYFPNDGRSTLYRVSDFSLFAPTTVRCTINPLNGDRLELVAHITGEKNDVTVIGPREEIQDLGTLLFDGVRRVLDSQACNMDSEIEPLKANHCLSAGARLLKNRSYDDALDPLTKAAGYYSLLAKAGSQDAAEKMLVTYDHLANLYDIEGERKLALDQIEKAFEVNEAFHLPPGNEGLLLIRRRQAQINGDVPAERDLLIELRDRDPEDPDRRHSLGWFLHTHDRNCNTAEVEFDDAIADPSTDPAFRATYFAYKGDIRLDCGDIKTAIELYDKYIARASDQADPYEMRAQAYMMVGAYDKARDDLYEARVRDSKTASLLKGNLERDRGNFANAMREYGLNFDQLGPNQRRDVLLARGRLHWLAGDLGTAQLEAQEAAALQGGSQVEAFWLLGLVNLSRGNKIEAKAALDELERRFAATPSRYLREYLHHLRAQVALAENQGDKAIAELQAAIANQPMDRLFFMAALADAYQLLGRYQDAYDAYGRLLAINPNLPRALCAAARLAQRLVLPEKAAELYREAQQLLDPQTDDPVCKTCLERQLAGDAP